MPISVRSVLAPTLVGGSLVLALTGPHAASRGAAALDRAVPAGDTCANVLGVARQYGEFIEGDARHTRGAEGAVAVGGNADFRGGFTVGRELSPERISALPGGNALLVAGGVTGEVRVAKGNGTYGGTLNGVAEAPRGELAKGPSPVDFAAEFTALRKTSAALAGVSPEDTDRSLRGGHLRLTGTDARYNAFVVPAADLERAKEVHLDVPAGAVTVVNVTGVTYDQAAAGIGGFRFQDAQDGGDGGDATEDEGEDGPVLSRLLWNFPEATKIVKSGAHAWPGTVLAPHASFDLGEGGPVDGTVIARSLTGKGSAETRHHPFTGCLPAAPDPLPAEDGVRPQAEAGPSRQPVASASASAPGSASATGPSAAPPTASPALSPSSRPGPSAVPAAGPGGPGGDLALTGAGMAVPLAIGGAAVLAAGAGMVLVARRRRA
ncbi:choice-of-anchor A family protein [Streptomyces sp. NPDC006512]|uniref:choice-of-anchor A family protein n=1 Tax=Streptomyces sp. NPDC006512 TaxID=3154307 RepID=UPI0033AF6961